MHQRLDALDRCPPTIPTVQVSDVQAVESNLRESLYSLEDRIMDKMAEMVSKAPGFQGRA